LDKTRIVGLLKIDTNCFSTGHQRSWHNG